MFFHRIFLLFQYNTFLKTQYCFIRFTYISVISILIDKVEMKKDYYDKITVYKNVQQATIETNFGNIVFELLPNYAPETGSGACKTRVFDS